LQNNNTKFLEKLFYSCRWEQI